MPVLTDNSAGIVESVSGQFHRIIRDEVKNSVKYYRESIHPDQQSSVVFGPFSTIYEAVYDIATL